MSKVHEQRMTAAPPPGTVVFLIGMRFNKLWKVHRWMPVFAAMPKMVRELERQPELGLLHARYAITGRIALVVQYWRSSEDLQAYARADDHLHLPAWRAFNRQIGTNGDVGIFHETYVVTEGAFEAVYGNMPDIFMGAALGTVPVRKLGESASRRLTSTGPDDPAVAPPA